MIKCRPTYDEHAESAEMHDGIFPKHDLCTVGSKSLINNLVVQGDEQLLRDELIRAMKLMEI